MKMKMELTHEEVQHLVELFHTYHDTILSEWLKVANISEDDPFLSEVTANGGHTIRLLVAYIKDPETLLIEQLTRKIAIERVEAKVGIGEFISNINLGRSIIYRVFNRVNIPDSYQMKYLMVINDFFDLYMYHAITEYTRVKDSIIQNKNQFIQEMHSDRLSILGQVAASFAHEFRNPLTSIKGFIQMIEKDATTETETYFRIIKQELDSLEDKITQFLYLSKMKGLDDQSEVFALESVVQGMMEFLYPRFLDENINVHHHLADHSYMFGVEGQIKQVLLNILNNAVEELSEIKGERTVKVNLCELDGNIQLTITNNGSMIPEHLLEDIFEPFISTKQLGTGLGLSVCKQIVEKHKGSIQVISTEEKTSFVMTFPKADLEGELHDSDDSLQCQ
ncbi:histidine kinase N-terminal domain-containing protein [Pseudalkalibacillus berkeleyi]|uniref:histidine kinase n=1 Tax=Pseudalkalibacillus berkeleyi TaxID=1069813 RepID=A0ABS9GVF3_9BACL|nr:histidine kinase N-terminal domain-containing protein [Pseudalkalibacillus berkeleyi]MCF6136798.1 ATP-binding protein [Pseudalkalibacillus berkeleyi]